MTAIRIGAHRSRPVSGRSRGFTLIELLVVISIIALLISILLPSLNRAKQAAKDVHTRGTLKAIGDGLELFRTDIGDSGRFARTNGYPPSALAEDPTENGEQSIVGAQWLVRYLMGKDLRGYVPRDSVPTALQNPGAEDEQVLWYTGDPAGDGSVQPFDRVGPYIETKVSRVNELPGDPLGAIPAGFIDIASLAQPVMVDAYGFPILYYVANPSGMRDLTVPMATYDGSVQGIYNQRDNALFTGACEGVEGGSGTCSAFDGWNATATRHHPINHFGPAPVMPGTVAENTKTFQYYILNKDAYKSTSGLTAKPYRTESFLLMAPGKDGWFGTADDVANF